MEKQDTYKEKDHSVSVLYFHFHLSYYDIIIYTMLYYKLINLVSKLWITIIQLLYNRQLFTLFTNFILRIMYLYY